MLDAWLESFPELNLLDVDSAPGTEENRAAQALVWFARRAAPPDEKALLRALDCVRGNDLVTGGSLAAETSKKASLNPDIHLLAGALHLYEGRFEPAVEALRQCYPYGGGHGPGTVGRSIRRAYPGLRFLLRISPVLLLPLYPDAYGAGLMYAVALWHGGAAGEALEVLREISGEQGLNDELKVVAAQIYLGLAARAKPESQRGLWEKARHAAGAPEQSQRDSVELARCFYYALACHRLGDARSGLRELSSALNTIREVNVHLHARARLLCAVLYAQIGLPLHALRHSAMVHDSELPRSMALEVASMEEQWLNEMSGLTYLQLEKLARSEAALLEGRMALEETEETKPLMVASKLDTSHDVLKDLRPREMSWLKRKAEEEQIAIVKTQVARGETPTLVMEDHLSFQGRQVRERVEAAQKWWPSRKEALLASGPRESLARSNAELVRHLGYDFNGSREPLPWLLSGEKRMNLLWALLGSAFGIWLVLSLTRSCFYIGR